MSKFNTNTLRTQVHAPITASRAEGQTTFEGAPAFRRDARSELFTLAVANMVAEHTFYENSGDRDERFERLVAKVAVEDPAWMGQFILWLRKGANMRSASLVAAVEAARAMLAAGIGGGRALVDAACQRADEPGEALAYWLSRHGRRVPMPVKRGLADAARRLYSEASALKYDAGQHTSSRMIHFGDVLELCHPRPVDYVQDALFAWLLNRRPGADRKVGGKDVSVPNVLETITQNRAMRQASAEDASVLTDTAALDAAGVRWEEQLSAAGDRVDKAQLWEAKIPTMGYAALLRNLSGFDKAGISDAAVEQVAARLADPVEVRRSRQFPFRFLTAWKALDSLRWGPALEQALGHSLANVPSLPGRTLILVDQSQSMFWSTSERSKTTLAEIAAIFASALALRAEQARLVQYGTESQVVPVRAGASLLRLAGQFHAMGGTNTAAAVDAHYAGHDRVVIVTDEQAGVNAGWIGVRVATPGELIPSHVPLYTWNLAGYEFGHEQAGADRRYVFGGLTDQAWGAIPMLEAGHNGQWPWETGAP